ncbi:MAG TPA: glycosyltransferase family 4 protein [Thermodesulfovibrionales bacterium]|nr:glycosyltransferase family 4 protein [Thermodesulfovibrionales bacterium]
MKVLQIIYESIGSPFGFGGAGIRCYEIYRRLKDRHDITLLCMRYPGAEDGEIEGLQHLFVGTESRSLSRSVLAYTFRAADFVRRHGDEFDIIVENFLPATPFFARFFTKTPVVLQVQGIMERHAFKKFSPFYFVPMYLVEMFYPRLYDRLIFVSDVTREKVTAVRRGKTAASLVIPNGIDTELLRTQPADGDYILFLSRIDIYTKGLDLLIDAFQLISPDFPNLRLILAGYEFDKFPRLVADKPHSLMEKIEFAGFVTGDEKLRLLSEARIFVLPSRHESSPISILEAAACGKALVVSDIPELSFVSREGFGVSFPTGSAEGLAEMIRILLTNREQRESYGRRGREYASQFLWDNIAIQFEGILGDTVAGGVD